MLKFINNIVPFQNNDQIKWRLFLDDATNQFVVFDDNTNSEISRIPSGGGGGWIFAGTFNYTDWQSGTLIATIAFDTLSTGGALVAGQHITANNGAKGKVSNLQYGFFTNTSGGFEVEVSFGDFNGAVSFIIDELPLVSAN